MFILYVQNVVPYLAHRQFTGLKGCTLLYRLQKYNIISNWQNNWTKNCKIAKCQITFCFLKERQFRILTTYNYILFNYLYINILNYIYTNYLTSFFFLSDKTAFAILTFWHFLPNSSTFRPHTTNISF